MRVRIALGLLYTMYTPLVVTALFCIAYFVLLYVSINAGVS